VCVCHSVYSCVFITAVPITVTSCSCVFITAAASSTYYKAVFCVLSITVYFKDTEPIPLQYSSGVRQKGDLLGPPPLSP
jgi:hypothetical protein